MNENGYLNGVVGCMSLCRPLNEDDNEDLLLLGQAAWPSTTRQPDGRVRLHVPAWLVLTGGLKRIVDNERQQRLRHANRREGATQQR